MPLEIMEFGIPPHRAKGAKALLKRVQRAAHARNVHFEFEVLGDENKPNLKDFGPVYATARSYPKDVEIQLWDRRKKRKEAIYKKRFDDLTPKEKESIKIDISDGSPLYMLPFPRVRNPHYQDWVCHDPETRWKNPPPETVKIEGLFIDYKGKASDFHGRFVTISEESQDASIGTLADKHRGNLQVSNIKSRARINKSQAILARYVRREVSIRVEHGLWKDSQWDILGTIEPIGEVKVNAPVMQRARPDLTPELDEVFTRRSPKKWPKVGCQHCHKNRRRLKLIMVRHRKKGTVKRVATSCVFEYCNIDPKLIENLFSLERYSQAPDMPTNDGFRKQRTAMDLPDFLTIAMSACAVHGEYRKGLGSSVFGRELVSRHDADLKGWGEKPPDWDGDLFLGHYHNGDKRNKRGWYCSTPLNLYGDPYDYYAGAETLKVIAGVMDFMEHTFARYDRYGMLKVTEANIESLNYHRKRYELGGRKIDSSYEQNLITIWDGGIVDKKSANFAASAYACYKRHADTQWKIAREAEKPAEDKKKAYEPPEDGKLKNVVGECVSRRYLSDWDSTIYEIDTGDGFIKWFGKRKGGPKIELGDTVKILSARKKGIDEWPRGSGNKMLSINYAKWEVV